MLRIIVSMLAVTLLGIAFGPTSAAADGARSVFDDATAPLRTKPGTHSKSVQRKRAALQQRVLIEQQELRGRNGSVEQNLERVRRQQAETLRAQQYGSRYDQRHLPRPDMQETPHDPIGQRLEALRQQQNDALRDQRHIQAQQREGLERALRGLQN